MRAIELPHFCVDKSPERTASERFRFRWEIAATVSFTLSATTFVAGSAVSALTALTFLASGLTTAYLTICLLVGSMAFACLGAHAMDRFDDRNG